MSGVFEIADRLDEFDFWVVATIINITSEVISVQPDDIVRTRRMPAFGR